VALLLAAVVLVSGVGVYWEWLRPISRGVAFECPAPAGGLGAAPPIIFLLNYSSSWSWERTSSGYFYNVTFAQLVATASTNWTAFNLINRTFEHSLIEYTVAVLNASFDEKAVFNSSHSGWRGSGPGPSEAIDNWTPVTGAPITAADFLQFQSPSNLTASGLYFEMEMGASSCGPWEGQSLSL
jgi:hypothetical protein